MGCYLLVLKSDEKPFIKTITLKLTMLLVLTSAAGASGISCLDTR